MENRKRDFGVSVYISGFDACKESLAKNTAPGGLVFTSLHISEEFTGDFIARARSACHWLAERGYRVIADISRKTIIQFGSGDMVELARQLRLHALRADYGFSDKELLEMSHQFPIAINASTVDQTFARRVLKGGGKLVAMHNFYPRPETGLGEKFLISGTQTLQGIGLPVWAFVPGDGDKRGPLYEGLPTLEKHRHQKPLCAAADLFQNFGIDAVFVGDAGISAQEAGWISDFVKSGVLPVPAHLIAGAEALYGQVFTCRVDSPDCAVRFAEAREYSCFGRDVPPLPPAVRARGAITIDNRLYGRYSGEVQLLRRALPADERVNVVGAVLPQWLPLADCIPNGTRFRLVEPDE